MLQIKFKMCPIAFQNSQNSYQIPNTLSPVKICQWGLIITLFFFLLEITRTSNCGY
jgi:hypothetical protein